MRHPQPRLVGEGDEALDGVEALLVIPLMCQPVRGEDISFNEKMIQILLRGLRDD